jgi:pyruvate,orthophosphate dikinase
MSDEEIEHKTIGSGLAASGGVAIGKIAFNCMQAEQFKMNNEDCILCRSETSADDISGLQVY